MTVFTQQIRALNLAWAIREGRKLDSGRVVVVGGGAAGLTVAAGLAQGGVSVTLLERERELLPLQRNCNKRYIHPHIFDWPDETSENTRADLPLLDWRAGIASDVARTIESSFIQLAEASSGLLEYQCNVQDVSLDSPSAGKLHFWNARNAKRVDLSYDVLVFALGFGIEKSSWSGSRGSYWADAAV